MRPKREERSPDAALDGTKRLAQPIGELGVSQILPVNRPDHRGVGRFETSQQVGHRTEFAALHESFFRVRAVVDDVVQGEVEGRCRLSMLAQAVERFVIRDSGQPGDRAGTRRVERLRAPPDCQIRLLQRIARDLFVAADAQADAEQLRAGRVIDCLERLRFALRDGVECGEQCYPARPGPRLASTDDAASMAGSLARDIGAGLDQVRSIVGAVVTIRKPQI